MQKLFIVALAVCLVSVHAFVKRDAPAAGADTKNYIDDFQKQLGDLSSQIQNTLKETFDQEKIKKNFNEVVTGVSKALEDLKPKTTEGEKKS